MPFFPGEDIQERGNIHHQDIIAIAHSRIPVIYLSSTYNRPLTVLFIIVYTLFRRAHSKKPLGFQFVFCGCHIRDPVGIYWGPSSSFSSSLGTCYDRWCVPSRIFDGPPLFTTIPSFYTKFLSLFFFPFFPSIHFAFRLYKEGGNHGDHHHHLKSLESFSSSPFCWRRRRRSQQWTKAAGIPEFIFLWVIQWKAGGWIPSQGAPSYTTTWASLVNSSGNERDMSHHSSLEEEEEEEEKKKVKRASLYDGSSSSSKKREARKKGNVRWGHHLFLVGVLCAIHDLESSSSGSSSIAVVSSAGNSVLLVCSCGIK